MCVQITLLSALATSFLSCFLYFKNVSHKISGFRFLPPQRLISLGKTRMRMWTDQITVSCYSRAYQDGDEFTLMRYSNANIFHLVSITFFIKNFPF